MKTIVHPLPGSQAIEVISDEILISNAGDTLELLSSLGYEHDCRNIIIHRENIVADFFNLKTRLLGDILGKASIYFFRLAVVGDFSDIGSEAFAAFVRESNRKRQFVFASSVEEVIQTFWQ